MPDDLRARIADAPCPFCAIVAGTAPAEFVHVWPDAVAIRPLNPVADGHLLVIPRGHVPDALADPVVTGAVMARAARLGQVYGCDLNLITSAGRAATQSVFHLHVHLVPRAADDGLPLPWTPQRRDAEVDRRVRAVRGLHRRYRGPVGEQDWCEHCNGLTGGWVAWPCETIQALGGDDE